MKHDSKLGIFETHYKDCCKTQTVQWEAVFFLMISVVWIPSSVLQPSGLSIESWSMFCIYAFHSSKPVASHISYPGDTLGVLLSCVSVVDPKEDERPHQQNLSIQGKPQTGVFNILLAVCLLIVRHTGFWSSIFHGKMSFSQGEYNDI